MIPKFKIGEIVQVVNNQKTYDQYGKMATKMGMKYWVRNKLPLNGHKYQIISIQFENLGSFIEISAGPIYGIRSIVPAGLTYCEFLIDQYGLKKIQNNFLPEELFEI